MARVIGKLNAIRVRNARKPGIYGDGGGLWLNVSVTGTKAWVHRFMLDGRQREMGLGPLHTISLAEARELSREARRMCLDGIDPIEAKHAARDARRLAAASSMTFEAGAAKYIAANQSSWRNPRQVALWTSTLGTYVYPTIGRLPVSAVETGHVTRVLQPIWQTKPNTASKVRGRIEAVLDFAKTHGWRTGENPARWKGHLEHTLPAPTKVRAVAHHAALPWREAATFMASLEQQGGVSALALRFTILTAARTGEALGCRWSEIDRQHAVWIVPPERMKSEREHRVPLSEGALDVLREMAKLQKSDFVFPGLTTGKALSDRAMLQCLERMGRDDLTVHGFRSTFRDWAAETGQPADIAEAALAHVIGDATVVAYARGDMLERRRRLMAEWGRFCERPIDATGQVVALRSA